LPDPSDTEIARDYFMRNSPWVRSGQHSYNTRLPTDAELSFRRWVAQNDVPFNPDAPIVDYDMRGFWKALQSKDPRATSAINPNDKSLHYPDYWKTPYHETFSAESQWANHRAPRWTEDDKLITPDGRVIFDERAQR
jgi:hypothetical protein